MPGQRTLFVEPEFLIQTVHSEWMAEKGYRSLTANGFEDARRKVDVAFNPGEMPDPT